MPDRCAAVVLWLAAASPAVAQTGFTPAGAERQREAEAAVLEAIAPAELEAMSRTLSLRMHVAGGPAQAAVRDTLAAWFHGWGFEPEVATYEVFLPWPTDVSLALTAPDTMAFHLSEEVLAADAAAALPHYPWVNGYSAPGEVEAEVVYVSHGLHEDYARLDSMGIGVEGRVALARYGRSYRGIKARLAAEHGAAALLLYSDPADDGYTQGDVYPEGPFRPWSGVQRGSVMNGTGDPTTPDGPSTAGAPRVTPSESLVGLPAIPVMPISYAVAGEIISRLGNADVPDQGWQGGLPFRYHAGPGPARVRLRVDDDRDGPAGGMKSIYDVTARIEGSQWPDEWIVVGAHIDAWGPGANDNVSGTASVLAAANAIRALADGGHPPRRTIVFAGWDGEEWGLIGSTEWVEEHAAELSRGGVAYINQDGVGGQSFTAAASPSLKPFLREASRAIHAKNGQSLHDVWQGEADSVPRLGDLGGGSDFAPFYNHLGIPSTGHGFGTPGGVYHSAYDTYHHMAEFGDPGFVHHAQTAELTAIMASRLANAEILPYDFAALGREMAALWKPLREAALADSLLGEDHDPLGHALAALEKASSGFAAVRDGYLSGPADPERSRRANGSLRAVERALTREAGLVGRPWYRSLTFAADDRNGYATLGLPGIAEAIRSGSAGRVRVEVDDMADRVGRATGSVAEAEAVLAP
ncbi:MAG: M20/M25/M40 family metallo-hydrolase [Gemmatimonadetes bacterium]|nr:M20/M25/M40 family metallo-hydrolase [Gemmatimonadota bacterium]